MTTLSAGSGEVIPCDERRRHDGTGIDRDRYPHRPRKLAEFHPHRRTAATASVHGRSGRGNPTSSTRSVSCATLRLLAAVWRMRLRTAAASRRYAVLPRGDTRRLSWTCSLARRRGLRRGLQSGATALASSRIINASQGRQGRTCRTGRPGGAPSAADSDDEKDSERRRQTISKISTNKTFRDIYRFFRVPPRLPPWCGNRIGSPVET